MAGSFYRWLLLVGFLLAEGKQIAYAQQPNERKKNKLDSSRVPAEWESVTLTSPETEENERESEEFLPSLLQAGTDPLLRAATFDWGILRYQWRGYSRIMPEYFINGALLNHPLTGRIPWYLVNGLSSRIRVAQHGMGLTPVDYAMGSLSGSTYLESTGRTDRKETGALMGYSGSRGAFRYQCYHATGNNSKDLSASFFFQFAHANPTQQIAGTLRSFSGMVTLEKSWDAIRRTYLLLCYAPQEVSKQPAITRELISLTGNERYNSNWGWQQNEQRFAGKRIYQFPLLVLTQEHRPNPYTRWRLAAAMVAGRQGDEGLDWYEAPDPRPDYYRYLPSFSPDSTLRYNLANALRQNPAWLQIDWQRLYAMNAASRSGNTASNEIRSRYILEERMAIQRMYSLHFNYHTLLQEHIHFSFGIGRHFFTQRFRRKVKDLLGGDYYLNMNGMAASLHENAGQYDLLQPDRKLTTGDYFGQDYALLHRQTNLWLQFQGTAGKWDWFLAGKWTQEQVVRRGYVVNGLFPLNSGGDSPPQFWNTGWLKMGITHKWKGRHFFYAHTLIQTIAPLADQVFMHAGYSHLLSGLYRSAPAYHGELGWVYRSAHFSSRLTGYISRIQQAADVQRFYSDQYEVPVNLVMKDLVFLHRGIEWSGTWQLHPDWEMDWAMVHSYHSYGNRPEGILYHDLTENLLATTTLHVQGYHLGNGPQQAEHLGLNYRPSGGWMINLSLNRLDQRRVSIQPLRRTAEALAFLPAEVNKEDWLLQERLPGVVLIHALVGYQWRLKNGSGHPIQLRCFVSARNLPGRQLLTGGYEQQRMSRGTDDHFLFPNKYFFSTGRYLTASLQITI